MIEINAEIPENILLSLKEEDTEFAQNMLKYTAIKLYEKKVITWSMCRFSKIEQRGFYKTII